ncbi:unnamed protein product [Prorocentrum cordatum]|uniref:Uncharacterized protein n=1 Tax=Prorocentrum cordatum TaxID=2364126 RepID=A0ABN9T5J7_9DINO|nr:unnamed protein product [Polarella glacialis]
MAGTRSASLDCAQSSPSSRSRGIRLGKIVRSPTPEPMRRSLTGGKRYYSRGFERPRHERRELWQQLPEGLDLLLTHGPPLGRLCSDKVGDELLKARLAEMAAPPRFHVFGPAPRPAPPGTQQGLDRGSRGGGQRQTGVGQSAVACGRTMQGQGRTDPGLGAASCSRILQGPTHPGLDLARVGGSPT